MPQVRTYKPDDPTAHTFWTHPQGAMPASYTGQPYRPPTGGGGAASQQMSAVEQLRTQITQHPAYAALGESVTQGLQQPGQEYAGARRGELAQNIGGLSQAFAQNVRGTEERLAAQGRGRSGLAGTQIRDLTRARMSATAGMATAAERDIAMRTAQERQGAQQQATGFLGLMGGLGSQYIGQRQGAESLRAQLQQVAQNIPGGGALPPGLAPGRKRGGQTPPQQPQQPQPDWQRPTQQLPDEVYQQDPWQGGAPQVAGQPGQPGTLGPMGGPAAPPSPSYGGISPGAAGPWAPPEYGGVSPAGAGGTVGLGGAWEPPLYGGIGADEEELLWG